MANVIHSTLVGTEVHEPKGIAVAPFGSVYVSNGSGSGTWTNIGVSAFTGMIADFTWPVVQEGWLECNGSDINIETYSALYNVMTIQMLGSRTSGSASITSLSSTSNMRVGYYVYGTGIPVDTTITAINSSTQITMSVNAGSTGTSTVYVSPWRMGVGTIRLPDLTSLGRYRRSRWTGVYEIGREINSQNLEHAHTYSGTVGNTNTAHSHTYSGSTGGMSANSSHSHTVSGGSFVVGDNPYPSDGVQGGRTYGSVRTLQVSNNTNNTSVAHTHAYSGTTSQYSANHNHTYSGTTSYQGLSEARPTSMVVMTCVKT